MLRISKKEKAWVWDGKLGVSGNFEFYKEIDYETTHFREVDFDNVNRGETYANMRRMRE